MKNKIGWCNTTWNPVWGCLNNNCEYCYARRIAKRFAGKIAEREIDYIYGGNIDGNSLNSYYEIQKEIIRKFKPTFLNVQFEKKFPQKTQKIFVGSMSEIKYWKKEWVGMILEKIRQHPQHIFQFLTKFPGVYLWYKFPINCWLGITVTDTKNNDYLEYQKFKISNPDNLKFISFEPIFNEISINLENIDWVILGAETGNRKGKIIPKKGWIENIVNYCKSNKIPIYLKDSLKEIYPEEIKEFPKIN